MGIAAADVCGTSDPYACVRVGTREERCRTVPATLQPIWDEVLRVEVPEGEDVETVLISIYDSDAWGDDDYLGSVEVPIAPLRSRRHLYHPYSLALEADDRFVAAADEEGASYAVTGTIIFHLKLTTQGALERIAAAEAMTRKGAEPDLDSLHRFVSGESFGRETMVDGIYPYSLNAEFACTLLRVSRADFIAHLLPLQDADTGRLVELFSEILTLSGWPPERLLSLRALVNVRRFRAGDTVVTEGEPVGGPTFILSGEVYTFKRRAGGGLGRPAADGRPASLGAVAQAALSGQGGFVSRLLRGDTIGFSAMLRNRPSPYTAIAATPVELVVSNVISAPVGEPFLIVHRGEGLNMRREMVADADECAGLCGREPAYGSDGQAIVACCDRERQWREFKERVVTGVVGDIRNRPSRRARTAATAPTAAAEGKWRVPGSFRPGPSESAAAHGGGGVLPSIALKGQPGRPLAGRPARGRGSPSPPPRHAASPAGRGSSPPRPHAAVPAAPSPAQKKGKGTVSAAGAGAVVAPAGAGQPAAEGRAKAGDGGGGGGGGGLERLPSLARA